MPRRRRSGAKALAIDSDSPRGRVIGLLLRHPKDVIAGAIAVAAIMAIVANALFLQAGHHPSPMFGGTVVTIPPALASASPLPRPRPPEASMLTPETRPADVRIAEPKAVEPKSSDARAADPLTSLVKATATTPAVASNVPRPPAAIPVASRTDSVTGSRRVAAVQRALSENGYGQLKATGTVGAETQAAIQKFERDRKIPVTGQMSDRLVRELTAMVGHPID